MILNYLSQFEIQCKKTIFFLSDRSGFTLGKIQTFLEVIVNPFLQIFSEQNDNLCNIVNSSYIFVYVGGNLAVIATLIYTKNVFWTFTSRTIGELYRITSIISWELEQKYENERIFSICCNRPCDWFMPQVLNYWYWCIYIIFYMRYQGNHTICWKAINDSILFLVKTRIQITQWLKHIFYEKNMKFCQDGQNRQFDIIFLILFSQKRQSLDN